MINNSKLSDSITFSGCGSVHFNISLQFETAKGVLVVNTVIFVYCLLYISIGTYQDAMRQPSCKLCPAGTYLNSTGSVSLAQCTPCPIGISVY